MPRSMEALISMTERGALVGRATAEMHAKSRVGRKRQRTAALQNLMDFPDQRALAAASWSAAVLCRFGSLTNTLLGSVRFLEQNLVAGGKAFADGDHFIVGVADFDVALLVALNQIDILCVAIAEHGVFRRE